MEVKATNSKRTYPRRKHIRLPLADYHVPGAWYFVTICCNKKEPHLKKSTARDLAVEVLLKECSAQLIEVATYAILPNHLHLICSAGRRGVVSFVQAFKSRLARTLRQDLNPSFQWQKSFFDHKIRNDESLREKCEYVWMNPVRRGLVQHPQDYRWSGNFLSEEGESIR